MHGAGRDIAHVLTYPEDYPAADLEAFQQGLERLALTGSPARVRASGRSVFHYWAPAGSPTQCAE
jgi:hypothetical protein